MGTTLQTHNSLGEANRRGARMLRTALGPVIASYLEDPDIVEKGTDVSGLIDCPLD